MARALPIFGESFQTEYDADLSGVAVRVRFTWIERTAAWYLSVFEPGGAVIVQGRRIGSKRPPLEGLRILDRVGDEEVLIPFGPDPYNRTAPPAAILLPRPAPSQSDSGLVITAVP